MRHKVFFVSTLLVFASELFLLKAEAVDLDWTGLYRIEAHYIGNPEASNSSRQKSYGLHHLVLKPKIVAGDGIIINARLDLFNSDKGNHTNSQMGQFFGSGIGVKNSTNANNSNAISNRQKSESVEVTQLYLVHTWEHGAFIGGRVPLDFGLGASVNSGSGPFDHWLETKDLLGYRMRIENFIVYPMLAIVSKDNLSVLSAFEYMIQAQYENPEIGLKGGVLYRVRKANGSNNDAPKGTAAGEAFGGEASGYNELDTQNTIIYMVRSKKSFQFGVEAAIQRGEVGVQTKNGENTSLSGFAAVTEVEYFPENSKFQYGLKAGMVSGDNPSTDNKHEGYWLNKNYDVASIMFNHPLGQKDLLRTSLTGSGAGTAPNESADTETISNVFYFAPHISYKLKKNWTLQSTVAFGYLNENPSPSTTVSKELGYEWDMSLNYFPKKGVLWKTDVGLLLPGKAFEGGGSFEVVYGLSTKAAISF